MRDCMTCKWITWSASIPLALLIGAGGFLVLAQVAVVQDNAPAVLLDLYLATWSYILAVAGRGTSHRMVAVEIDPHAGLHMRFGHVEGTRKGCQEPWRGAWRGGSFVATPPPPPCRILVSN